MLTSSFDVDVLRAHGPSDTVDQLLKASVDLVLINRKLDQDYSDGLEILKMLKADERFQAIPVMLVTNHQDHQHAAISAGALHGFGKLELDSPQTRDRLSAILG